MLLQAVLLLPEHDKLLEFFPILLSAAKEVVLEQFLRVGAPFRLLVETPRDEVLEGRGPLSVLESRGVLSHD